MLYEETGSVEMLGVTKNKNKNLSVLVLMKESKVCPFPTWLLHNELG